MWAIIASSSIERASQDNPSGISKLKYGLSFGDTNCAIKLIGPGYFIINFMSSNKLYIQVCVKFQSELIKPNTDASLTVLYGSCNSTFFIFQRMQS